MTDTTAIDTPLSGKAHGSEFTVAEADAVRRGVTAGCTLLQIGRVLGRSRADMLAFSTAYPAMIAAAAKAQVI